MKPSRSIARVYDTPKAGPVRITNTITGETRTEPPLSGEERRKLARSRRRNENIIAFSGYAEQRYPRRSPEP